MDSVSLSHHTVVEIAAKIHEPSMQFSQYNCRVLYPIVSSLYETDDRSTTLLKGTVSRDFLLLVFSPIDYPLATDEHPKTFSNSVSNSLINQRKCVDPAVCRIARYHDPALYRIAQDQNGIALDQKGKL
jgi:hypothetical protein